MATMQPGNPLAKATTLSGRIRRRLTTAPILSRPTMLQLFLPRSIPKIAICIAELPSSRLSGKFTFAGKRGGPFHKSLRAAEQERADVARARRRWIRQQHRLKSSCLVFIDETSVTTTMARLYGRCRRGERLIGRVPLGAWKA